MANYILIGLGGTGYNVLREIRKRFWEKYPDAAERNKQPVRFLYIDSDEDMTPAKLAGRDDLRVNGQDTAITPNEYLSIKNVNINFLFDNIHNFPGLKHVVGGAEFTKACLGEVGKAAGQKRRAGRILFASNVKEFNDKINYLINDVQHVTGNNEGLNIFVFTGLAGGTGSGSVVDAVSQLITRHPEASVEVFAMLPEQLAPDNCDAGRYHANGYAAISELSALNAGAFLPSDVATGNEHIAPDPDNSNKRFGLTVYSNTNRNGAVVDSFTELPKLLADVICFRIFNQRSVALERLNRFFKSENKPNYLVEYKTNTKKGAPVERARSKALGSFGIKRLRYPSERLALHAAESVAQKVMGMMLYLNYDNDRGFLIEEPIQRKEYGEYLNEANLKNWKLHSSDLSLSVPILMPVSGQNPPTFKDFWENEVALDFDYSGAKKLGHALQIVEQYFDERYKDEFRDKKGVEAYFLAKSNPQVINDCAQSIVDLIKTNLFNQWVQGQYSANDVKRITEKILELLQVKRSSIDGELMALTDRIGQFVNERNDLLEEFNNVGFIKNVRVLGLRGREQIFVEYTKVLADEYVARTNKVSLEVFQRALMPKLIQLFTDLQNDIQRFVGRLDETIKEFSSLIAGNTPASQPDLRKAMIEVADIDRLERFERSILLDKQKMETMAQAMRNYVAQNAGNSFIKLTARLNSASKLEAASHEVLDELVKSYHAEMMRAEPVLGMNVLDQLYEMYGNNDTALGSFAGEIIRNSEVYISLNEQEIGRMMTNTEKADPSSILLVAIPDLVTDDEEKQNFIERFKLKLNQAYNGGGNREYFVCPSPLADEITVLSYQNLFPARGISYMPFLKQKYEELVNTGNQATDKANHILLHSEGDGTLLPPLFGEGEGPKGDELIKYLFLAAAFGIVRTGEDELGHKGWGIVETDDFDVEIFSIVSSKFSNFLSGEEFTHEMRTSIVEKVDRLLSESRHVDENARMSGFIKTIMKEYVLPESGSPSSTIYKKYAEQAKAALEILNTH